MKKLFLVVLILFLLILSSCAPQGLEYFIDIGPRGNLAPCDEAKVLEYTLELDGVSVKCTLPHHKGAKGKIFIKKDDEIIFSCPVSETLSPDEYKGMLQKAGWAETKLASVAFPGDTPLLRAFALMLEADYSLQGRYLPKFSTWTEIPVPRSLVD